jgi:hypothetical protein
MTRVTSRQKMIFLHDSAEVDQYVVPKLDMHVRPFILAPPELVLPLVSQTA